MADKLFKNKEEYERFIKQYSILDSTKFQYGSKEDFLNFMNEIYEIMLKKDDSFLYSQEKLSGKIELRKLLMKLDAQIGQV